MKARTEKKTSWLQICGCVRETYTLYVERALSKRPLCHRTHCLGPLGESKAHKASVLFHKYIYTWRVSNYTHCAIYILFALIAHQSLHEDGQFFGDDGELNEGGADVRLYVVFVEGRVAQFVHRPGQVHLVVHVSCNRRAAPVNWIALEKRLGEISQPYLGSEQSIHLIRGLQNIGYETQTEKETLVE
jgi:hypothetical protein